MRNRFSGWMVGTIGAVVCLLALSAGAQQADAPATGRSADGQQADQGQCEAARENFQEAKQAFQEARQDYRQAVEQYGRESEQAQAAQRELKQAQHKVRAAANRGKHCRRHDRRDESDAATERSAERRRNRDAQSTQRPRNRRVI